MTDLESFIRHQERRGLSWQTIRNRTFALDAFTRWLGRDILTAEREEIETFLDSRNLGTRSRYWWISTISCYFRWAITEELAEVDPTVRIARPRMRKLTPRPMDEVRELAPALARAEPEMRAWLLLASYQGMRCQEIAGMERGDVLEDRDPPVIVVVCGKGDKERVLPLHPEVAAALQALDLPTSGPLWRDRFGRPLTASSLSKRVNRYLRRVGVKATAHQGRHYFATRVYALSKDLRMTQELLGHSDPATTAIYAAWDQRGAAAVVNRI